MQLNRHRAEVVELRPESPSEKPAEVSTPTPKNVSSIESRPQFKENRRAGRIDRFWSNIDFVGHIIRQTSDDPVQDMRYDRRVGREVDFRKRRIAAGIAGVTVVATVVGGLGTLGANFIKSRQVPALVKTVTPPAPVVCVFSEETFLFVPNEAKGEGWHDAILRTQGAIDDAACFAQEEQLLENLYGPAPHDSVVRSHSEYANGYPVPVEVHRVTTTTSTVPTTVTPQN